MKKILFVILTVVFVVAMISPVAAQTDQEPARAAKQEGAPLGLKIVDIVFVRPVCVVGSVVSTAAYVAISPVVFIMGVAEPAARAMVEAPWRFTTYRYVGQFDHYEDGKPINGVWEF